MFETSVRWQTRCVIVLRDMVQSMMLQEETRNDQMHPKISERPKLAEWVICRP